MIYVQTKHFQLQFRVLCELMDVSKSYSHIVQDLGTNLLWREQISNRLLEMEHSRPNPVSLSKTPNSHSRGLLLDSSGSSLALSSPYGSRGRLSRTESSGLSEGSETSEKSGRGKARVVLRDMGAQVDLSQISGQNDAENPDNPDNPTLVRRRVCLSFIQLHYIYLYM